MKKATKIQATKTTKVTTAKASVVEFIPSPMSIERAGFSGYSFSDRINRTDDRLSLTDWLNAESIKRHIDRFIRKEKSRKMGFIPSAKRVQNSYVGVKIEGYKNLCHFVRAKTRTGHTIQNIQDLLTGMGFQVGVHYNKCTLSIQAKKAYL